MNIYKKLVEVRKQVSFLQKQKGNQYEYVSSSQVLHSIKNKLDEVGLLLIPEVIDTKVTENKKVSNDKYGNEKVTVTYFTEVNMYFTWVNIDNPDETIKCKWYAQGIDIAGEKGVGKAYTYAEKYFILKQFNIATDKDDPDEITNKNENKSNNYSEISNKTITNKQLTRLYAIMKNANVTEKEVKTFIKSKYNLESKTCLNQDQYNELCTRLENKKEAV